MPQAAPKSEIVFVVDDNSRGHHLTYIMMIGGIFRDAGFTVVTVFPHNPSAPEAPQQAKRRGLDYVRWDDESLPPRQKRFGVALGNMIHAHRLIRGWLRRQAAAPARVRVFFPNIERMMLLKWWHYLLFKWRAPYQYAGLLTSDVLNPQGNTIPRFFKPRKMRSIFSLNELVMDQWRSRGFRKAHWVPDVSPVDLPASEPVLAQRLRQFAQGRKIILLYGHLNPRKGLGVMTQVIETRLQSGFCVAAVGHINFDMYPPEVAQKLRSAAAGEHPSIFAYPHYVEDERDLNAIIAMSDLIYANYVGWGITSNTLYKCSSFRLPILVNQAGVLGARVRKFKIGRTLVAEDLDEIAQAIREVTAQPRESWGFDAFLKENNPMLVQQSIARAFE